MKEKTIELFTDGACKGKTKKGGYAAYLPHRETVICGTENNTTNNKMELQAVISGLKAIEAHIERIEVYTDSQYVCNGANKWMNNWKRNGWKTREGEDVKNKELWIELQNEISQRKKVKFNWVKGHADNYNNNLCDAFATAVTKCKD